MKVTPDRYLTYRYAGASGDFNPIHLDDEFARSVGLPGRILHGLWTMAQVARAQTEAAGDALALESLEVQFRGVGLPEAEITVTSETGEDGTITCHAEQNGRRSSRAGGQPARRLGGADALPGAPAAQGRRGVPDDRAARRIKALAADPDITRPRGPQRARRARGAGPLAHPHTSAGRAPTDAGHRYYVDQLLPETAVVPASDLRLELVRREVDEAMRVTTETLSQVTDLLAIVSAPPIETATIRHIEVLVLQPQVLMVVIITSTGGVSPMFGFDCPVDAGLADWAASYLNERLVGSASAPARCAPRSPTRRCRRSSAFLEQPCPPSPSLPGPPTRRRTSTAPRG